MTNQNKDGQVVKLAMKMASTLQDFYCERLGDFYVIGATTAFWIGHKIISPFLAKKTRDKIKIINKLEELEQYYDKNNIYEELGGSLKYSYDPHTMWNLPKEGQEEGSQQPTAGFAGNEGGADIDYDALIKQQYEQAGMQLGQEGE